MEIKFLKMKKEDAKEYFDKSYSLFRKVIDKDESIYDYDIHFDWSKVEQNHNANLFCEDDFSDYCDGHDYYFIDGNKKYALDMSQDIDDFGYNDEYFRVRYQDIYDDLYCCTITTYRELFDYEDRKLVVTFLYDKGNDKVVEILNINRQGIKNENNKKHVRTLTEEEELNTVLQEYYEENNKKESQENSRITAIARQVAKYKKDKNVKCIYFTPYLDSATNEVMLELTVVFSKITDEIEETFKKYNEGHATKEAKQKFGGRIKLVEDMDRDYTGVAMHVREIERVRALLSSTILYDPKGRYNKIAHQFDRYGTVTPYPNTLEISVKQKKKVNNNKTN